MPQTETINMSHWQAAGWKIITLNVPELLVHVNPPSHYNDTEEWHPPEEELEYVEQSNELHEDAEDIQDARTTQFLYRSQGVKGFLRYRDHRR
jgi:hypothetical protein